MEAYPRPDLTKILPTPWVHRIAGPEPALGRALRTTARPADDFVLDVVHRPDVAADEPGFGIAQALAVAARIAARLRGSTAEPPRHHVDGLHAQRLLEPDGS